MKTNFYLRSNKFPTVLIIIGLLLLFISFPAYRVVHSLLQGGITMPILTIEGILPNSPASSSSIEKGDQIISINGTAVNSVREFIALEDMNTVNTISIKRNGQMKQVEIMPNVNQHNEKLGIFLTDFGIVKKPFYSLIPNVLVDSYLGWEEKPELLLQTKLYKDQALLRLKLLEMGTVLLLLGLYLKRKMR